MRDARHTVPAEWLLLYVHSLGMDGVIGGIILIDHKLNKLHVRIRRDLLIEDQDVIDLLTSLPDTLEQQASEIGADELVACFEDQWSHTFRLGHRHAVVLTTDPSTIVTDLLNQAIVHSSHNSRDLKVRDRVLSAGRALPFSSDIAQRALMALKDPSVSFSAVETILIQDASISAHLVRLANSALYAPESTVRSIPEALVRVGTQTASVHIAAFTARSVYAAPRFRTVWDHSVHVAAIARQISKQIPSVVQPEVTLVALIHDIGRLAFLLVDGFVKRLQTSKHSGTYLVEEERRFCGLDHGEIGAILLESWNFPPDMVMAVKHHHCPPLDEEDILAQVVRLAEYVSQSNESMPSSSFTDLAKQLRINVAELDPARIDEDLEPMRFAAAV
jgi:putative nucleotidyltransferase with HDIG domain